MDSNRAFPASASPILGRDAEVDTVAAQLRDGVRLVVLTGPPGVGKTRLAVAVAAELAETFRDGLAWVDLTSVRDPTVVVDEIVHSCGLPHAAALQDRELLAVVDNCEHLLEAAPAIAALVGACAGLRILATSRERLRLAVERDHQVLPLPVPIPEEAADLRALARNPAVRLMLERAPAYVSLTARTATPLVEICRRLDGLPLALEFAAARLRVFTPGELAFRLDRGTGELTDGARDAPDRHRDLRAAILWSHDLLPTAERVLFRRLSVFEGGWTLAGAVAVCADAEVPDVLAALESLLDKNLVRRVDNGGSDARFGMLSSIHEYAAEQLETAGGGAVTRLRHADYFAGVAQQWEETIGTNAEDMTWAQADPIRADLEAALDTATAHGTASVRSESAHWLTAALGWFWYVRGSPLHAGGLSVGAADDGGGAIGPQARAASLAAAGALALSLGDTDRAARTLRTAYDLARSCADVRHAAISTAFLGHVEREWGRTQRAAAHYAQAREIWAELANTRGTAWAACDLGLLLADADEPALGEDLLREALALFEPLSYPWAVAVASCGLAAVRVTLGDPDEACRLAHQALRLHERVGDLRGIAQSLEVLAEIGLVRDSSVTAARLLGAAAAQRERVAAHPTEAEHQRTGRVLAGVSIALGRSEAEREQSRGRRLSTLAVIDLAGRIAPDPDGRGERRAQALTPRQLEVAALVAGGRTNRQIARELGISEKTAELHLRNIMQRLTVHNRTGVAVWVAAGGHRDQDPAADPT